jgi:spermidine synthase
MRRRRALFVGLGGGVAVRQFARVYPGIAIDVVEREPAVVDLARAYYGLDSIPGVTVHSDDGLHFLALARPSTWDVIVLDAYDAADLEPRFAARSLFGLVKTALCPGGAMAINVIGTLDGRSPVRDVLRAARAELSDVRVVPVMTADEAYSPGARRNVVVVATRPVDVTRSR